MILSTSIRSWFGHLIRWVKTIFSLKGGLVFLLVVLFSAFVAVMVSESVEKFIGQLLGLSEENDKNKILTFLGIGMGGILLALQAVIANRRAKAMENAANSQAEANRNTEWGQRQERFKNAIEHLGHNSDSVRLGGAYELFHLAQDNKDLCQTVMDILCAHIRRTTGENEYQQKHPSKPSEEVQSLLTLLFVQEYKIFKDCHINLQGSWLNGADLQKAHLEEAVLQKAHLHKANLGSAFLHGTDLMGAHLPGADLTAARLPGALLMRAHLHKAILTAAYLPGAILVGAHLPEADLTLARLPEARLNGARLHGADLTRAHLEGAILLAAHLPGAYLNGTYLHGADLTRAHLQGALLIETYLQGAKFHSAQLQGVRSYEEDLLPPFANRMRNAINQESDLSEVTFTGGLSREDLDYIVKDLSDQKAGLLRAKLERHIDKPASNQLPEDSGAITGAYTEKEAEQWIAEYEEAMSEVPKADNGQ